jgi:predicted dehydrogenase
MNKIKIGIIGFGKMGKIRAEVVEKIGMGEIICIYDTVHQTDTKYKQYNDIDKVLNSGIEVLFICTPNYRIKDLTISAIKKGIHVFAEKPPGINLDEALCMHNELILNNMNTVLMFGFNHRHHASVQKMKKIIDENTMGKVLWMRGRYGKEVDSNFFKGWRVKKELSGGGIMLDQGIHMLDLFLFLGGDFDEVKSFVSNLFWKIPDIEDNVFAIFKNSDSGLCASLHSTMTQWRYIFSLEIFMEKGSLILNGLKTSSGAYGDEVLTIKYNDNLSHSEEIIYHEDISWKSEILHFFDCISKCKQPQYGNTEDAIKLMGIIDKIYKNGI